MGKEQPKIIIVKKKKAHGHGHHGGSWKVAYADFVTAMMAFFMVMWIMGLDEDVRKGIESYFSSPVGHKDGYSAGVSPIAAGTSPGNISTTPVRLITQANQKVQFEQLGDRIRERLQGEGLGAVASQVEIVITKHGMRIELVEAGAGETFFPFGSADVKPAAQAVLQVIAGELSKLDDPVVVEGHTDAVPYGSRRYSNWELSADRANAARRVMEASGLEPGRILEIRGHADRHLRLPGKPLDPSNRRTSIFLPFSTVEGPIIAPAGSV